MPTMSSSTADRAQRSSRDICGRCARSMSSNWAPIVMTGFSALSELCSTTAISDHRRLRNCCGPAARMSIVPFGPSPLKGFEWNSTWPPVITAGGRSSRIAAIARVVFPLPLSPARPSTRPRRKTGAEKRHAYARGRPPPPPAAAHCIVGETLTQHLAPVPQSGRRAGGRSGEAEEGDGDVGVDRRQGREQKRGGNDGNEVGKDLGHDDAEATFARDPGRFNEVSIAEG